MDSPSIPTLEEWRALDRASVSAWVQRCGGSTVAVVEGTRRWYQFTHLRGAPLSDPLDYLMVGGQAYTDLIELLLLHGLEPLFIPIFVPQDRGQNYTWQMLARGVPAWFDQPKMVALLSSARVRLYGGWPDLPAGWTAARQALGELREKLMALENAQQGHAGPRLFLRLHTVHDDPAEELLAAVGQLTARLGRVPTRPEVLEELYSLSEEEQLAASIKLFLNSELRVTPFIPALLGGVEEPYFLTDSLLALDERMLRNLLYDFVFLRHGAPGTAAQDLERYDDLSPQQRNDLARWHARRSGRALGLGARHSEAAFWYPSLAGGGSED